MKKEDFGLEAKATKYVGIAVQALKHLLSQTHLKTGFITGGKREMPN